VRAGCRTQFRSGVLLTTVQSTSVPMASPRGRPLMAGCLQQNPDDHRKSPLSQELSTRWRKHLRLEALGVGFGSTKRPCSTTQLPGK